MRANLYWCVLDRSHHFEGEGHPQGEATSGAEEMEGSPLLVSYSVNADLRLGSKRDREMEGREGVVPSGYLLHRVVR